MLYLAIALLVIDVALGYTVYRQDKFLDELSDKLYDAENSEKILDVVLDVAERMVKEWDTKMEGERV
jgi:uncharacterized protein YoxC